MRDAEIKAIGALEAQVSNLCDRMARAETGYQQRHKEIYGHLGKLEASNQFNKGRMSWIGWVASAVVVAISAAIATLINQYMEG